MAKTLKRDLDASRLKSIYAPIYSYLVRASRRLPTPSTKIGPVGIFASHSTPSRANCFTLTAKDTPRRFCCCEVPFVLTVSAHLSSPLRCALPTNAHHPTDCRITVLPQRIPSEPQTLPHGPIQHHAPLRKHHPGRARPNRLVTCDRGAPASPARGILCPRPPPCLHVRGDPSANSLSNITR